MPNLLILGRGAKRAVVPTIGIALIAYMSYHAFIGERGLLTYWQLEEQARELSGKLAALQAERALLEHRIALLNSERIDPDMLDERARAVLNYTDPNEIVIMDRGK